MKASLLAMAMTACAASKPIEVAAPAATSTIAAPDGEGRWTVSVERGVAVRAVVGGEPEAIGDRLGLGDRPLRALAGSGTTLVALLADGVAVSTDGKHLEVYPVSGVEAVAVAPGRVAVALRDRTEVWELAAHTRRRFGVHATALAFTSDRGGDALLVTTPRGLLVERGSELVAARLPPVTGDAWQTDVAPVFARVCAHCHLPGGDAGVDLSNAAAWRAERRELRARVLEAQTMPPPGYALSFAERATLSRWLAGSR